MPQRYRVFCVCVAGIFITVFDTSSAIVALPTIAAEFRTDLTTVQWVIIANSLTIAALLVPMGRLSDLIGRKRIYIVGCVIFGLFSLLAAFTESIFMLISARALVGIGSAMTQGTAMALLVGNFEPHERARMLGLHMAGVGVGAMAGPAIGGMIVGWSSWRMLFMLTALGMLVVAVAGQQVLQRRKKRPDSARQPFDLAGAVLFSGLLTAGLLTLTLGPRVGWSDPYAICGTAIFLALVAAFVWTERRHPAPMLDFALLRNGEFAMGALSAVVAFMCISAMRFLAPFFFQGVKGFSPQQVGLLMLPAAMIMALSAPLVGRLADRLGVRLVANVGLSVAGIGLALFTAIQLQTPTWGIVAALVVMGLGMASFSAPNSASILNAVGAEAHGVASGIVNLCRNTGNIIGIAFGTAVVTLTMGRAGFPASLSAVGLDAEAGLLESFTSGVQITALVLVTVLVPVLALVVGWTVRRSRR